MKERNQPFIEPGENYIIVEKLTPEIIEETIKAFVEYWLKLLHISSYFDIETLNNLRDHVIKEYHIDDIRSSENNLRLNEAQSPHGFRTRLWTRWKNNSRSQNR